MVSVLKIQPLITFKNFSICCILQTELLVSIRSQVLPNQLILLFSMIILSDSLMISVLKIQPLITFKNYSTYLFHFTNVLLYEIT
jgi:hypothetical protein